MAGDWIKIQNVTLDKPEVYQIADQLSLDPDAVLGKLLRVWIWADTQTYDGTMSVPYSQIDRMTNAQGFAEALESVGWLSDDGFTNFDRHNGATAKSRSMTAKRVSKHRASKEAGNADVTQSVTQEKRRAAIPRPIRNQIYKRDGNKCVYCGRNEGEYAQIGETKRDGGLCLDHVIPYRSGGADSTGNLVTACVACNLHKSDRTPDEAELPWPTDENGSRYGSVTKPLPEKRIEEKSNVLAKANTKGSKKKPHELPFDSQEFSYAWNEWQTYLIQKRKKPTKITTTKQLNQLSKLNEDDAIITINNSIQNGWQGLFPSEGGSRVNHNGSGRAHSISSRHSGGAGEGINVPVL